MFPRIKKLSVRCADSDCVFLYLEESLGLGDHVGQALGGSQVLAQVPLVWSAQAVLPVTRPAVTTQEQDGGQGQINKQTEVQEVVRSLISL